MFNQHRFVDHVHVYVTLILPFLILSIQVVNKYNSRRTRGAEQYCRQSLGVDTGTVTNDEVAKSGRTGVTTACIENMLSRERTMDCIIHIAYKAGRPRDTN